PALAGLLLVAVIGLLDSWVGSGLSFFLLYLLPVALAAWCGGFPHGVLLALAGALTWHLVDAAQGPGHSVAVQLWNGVLRFGTFVLAASPLARLRASIRRERLLARTDALTGAANARTFYEAVHTESGRSDRSGRPFTLAYLDLDDFKQLNDRLGHAAG